MSDRLQVVAEKIFINEHGELRSVFRVIAFILAFILAAILVQVLLEVFATLLPPLRNLLRPPDQAEGVRPRVFLYYILGQMTNLAAALIASALCARLLERRSLASVGYKLHRGWVRDFALGSVLGAGSLALAVGIAAAAGAVSFTGHSPDAWFLARAFAVLFVFFLLAAAVEELLFRGFPFQALIHNAGPFVAIAVTSILFGTAHIANANASLFSTINTMLAGVWLGIAYLMTRSLWLATALHYAWNLTMAFVFGLPVSGGNLFSQLSWLKGQDGPPEWLSGGGYGPEGGAAVTLVLVLSTLAIWKSGLFAPREEMLAALKHGGREPRFISPAAEPKEIGDEEAQGG
ncbi:MAG TPA: CPBP family intramembrane glutamic endopeptidase [Blastocatellia bacterium]|nr:CPBP family intramembrane glutamic endopeptidase [Blastocatellia bacterium]